MAAIYTAETPQDIGAATADHLHSGQDVGAVNSVKYDTTPTLVAPFTVGQRFWDTDNQCMATVTAVDGGGNITSLTQDNQELPLYWTNDDAVIHYNGQPVYVVGGTGKRAKVRLADASVEATSYTVALATNDVASGQAGKYTTFGSVSDIPIGQGHVVATTDDIATEWLEGLPVYLSTETGKLTVHEHVAPDHNVRVGTITEMIGSGAGTKATILVGIEIGYELDELHDVLITDKQPLEIIQRNATNTLWENKTLTEAGIEATANKVTSISAASNNTEYPSAKVVFDELKPNAELMTILTPSAGAAGTQTLDLSLGRAFKINCATNLPTSLTIALSNIPTGDKVTALTLILVTGAGALPTVTWPTGVTAPTLAISKTSWYTLATENNGTATRIFTAGAF